MLIEIFYDSETDKKTPELAESLKYKYGSKVEVKLTDTSEVQIPVKYGSVNPPAVVLGGNRIIKLEAPESLENIVTKAIF
jgi:cell division ATPase FtsA